MQLLRQRGNGRLLRHFNGGNPRNRVASHERLPLVSESSPKGIRQGRRSIGTSLTRTSTGKQATHSFFDRRRVDEQRGFFPANFEFAGLQDVHGLGKAT
ncbi:MAG: hypothetical protein V7K64_11510 [Nostoc sp.]|uniref:hypothetical protein n=1 Tax=unclassified Nostoc TaxID=2593658 RepID=UPI001E15C768|nr:hypothetical protein [Nostoc sp. JL34]MBN3884055.1 hypothetical protein [Nostoc sp. JL34]